MRAPAAEVATEARPRLEEEREAALGVTDPAQVRATLEEFIGTSGPAFLEVMVDQNAHVYPMVAPGMGYKDMITGKWIKSREQKPPSSEEPSGYF